jgi:deoxycytidylate deaminase
MGLFSGRRAVKSRTVTKDDIKQIGTAMRATVTDVIIKRNGYIVMAIYEDRELGTQRSYKSELLTQQPCVHIGGEVIVYVDNISSNGSYFVDC